MAGGGFERARRMVGRGSVPKHAVLAAEVRRLVGSGRFGVGDAIPGEQALAHAFGCSRGTVRRALDTLVHEGLIRRRRGAGHFVARPLGSGREPLIGLILPNILNAEMLRLSQRFTLEATRRGYRIVLGVMEEQAVVEREFISDLHRLKASGLIKFPTSLPDEEDLRAHIRSLGLPHVIVNDFWLPSDRDHHVCCDEAAGLEMAVEHLVNLGHRRIGWVDGSDGPRVRALATLQAMLARYGLAIPEKHVLLCPPYETPPIGPMFSDRESAPTAIVTPYDGIAVRLIEEMERLGLCVPDDVSVVNLNGYPFYALPGMDLSTVIPPDDQIVRRVFELLTQHQQDQALCRYLCRPAFHVGRTTAAPRDVSRPETAGAVESPSCVVAART